MPDAPSTPPATLEAFFDDFTRRDWQTLAPDPAAIADAGGPVRIAVVGLGWFTRDWALPGIERSPYTEATVAVDIDPDRVAAVTDARDLIGLSPEQFHEGIASDAYDAVYVCTPNATHLEYVRSAAERDVAVLCEKPMAADLADAERIVETVEQAGVTLMIGYRMQTDPVVRRARELMAAGFIGDPVHVHADMSQTMLEELGDVGDVWRLNPEQSGGAALMDIGLYPLNTTRFLLDADPVTVYGQTVSEHEPFSAVDEHVAYTLTFPDDVHALCTASQNAQHTSLLQLTGTEGQLTLDPAFYEREDRGLEIVRGTTETTVDFEQAHQLEEEFAYFGHCLLTDTDPYPDGHHALTDMQVLDAIYTAADRDAPVSL